MTREYSQYPILAVSATVFNPHHDVLLIQRANPPAKGKWALPGGAVQLGETPENALSRELKEECGIDIFPVKLNRISSHIFHDLNDKIQYHYVILNYCCDLHQENVQLGSDAIDYRWVSFSEMQNLNLAEGVYETVQDSQMIF